MNGVYVEVTVCKWNVYGCVYIYILEIFVGCNRM